MSEEKKIKCLLPNFTKSRRKINKVIFLFNIFSIVNINVIYTFFFLFAGCTIYFTYGIWNSKARQKDIHLK